MTLSAADIFRAGQLTDWTGLTFTYTAQGWQIELGDPFQGAPLADDDHLKPHGTYAAYARHKRHGEKPCEPCMAAVRKRSKEQYRQRRAQTVHTDVHSILTTPTGSPMLVSVAGQRDSIPSETVSAVPSDDPGNCRPGHEGLTA